VTARGPDLGKVVSSRFDFVSCFHDIFFISAGDNKGWFFAADWSLGLRVGFCC
jgi:hypothetical protein